MIPYRRTRLQLLRRLSGIVLTAGCLCAPTTAVRAAELPQQSLHELAESLQRLETAKPAPTPAACRKTEAAIAALARRTTSSGERDTLSRTASRLRGKRKPAEIRKAAADARALIDSLTAARRIAGGRPVPDAGKCLNEVLARREFRWTDHIMWMEWLSYWVLRGFVWLMGWFHIGTPSEATVRIIAWVLLTAVAGLLLYLVWRTVAEHLRFRIPAGDDEELGPRVTRIDLGSPQALLRLAEEHLRAGRLRDALAAYYRAMLAALDRADLIQYAPHRTNREYVRQLSRAVPATGATFSQATRLFESHWYGALPVTTAACQQLAAYFHEVQEQARLTPEQPS